MIQSNLNNLETELWSAADDMRSNAKLNVGEFKDQLRGLVFCVLGNNAYKTSGA